MNEWLRRFVYYWLGFLVSERYYRSEVTGYQGWLSAPLIGTVAFRRDDGSLEFKW